MITENYLVISTMIHNQKNFVKAICVSPQRKLPLFTMDINDARHFEESKVAGIINSISKQHAGIYGTDPAPAIKEKVVQFGSLVKNAIC